MSDPTGSEAPPQKKSQSPVVAWVKKNPTAAKIALLGALAVVMGVILVWRFSGGNEKKKPYMPPQATAGRAGTRQPRPPAPPGQPTPPKAPDKQTDEKEEPQTPDEAPKPPEKKSDPDEKPKRPDDVATWTGQDFYDARKEGDPRLIEAIGQLAARAPGNPNVAENLARLLAPPKDEEETQPKTRPGYRHPSRTQDPKLIEAIVAALDANASNRAREILEQLLAGSIPSDDDKTAVEATLKTLAANPRQENEDLLYDAVTRPQRLRPEAEGDVTADQLRQMALAVVESASSEGFRERLAKYLIEPTTPVTRRVELEKFLGENQPVNLPAQLVIYQSDEMAKEDKGMRAKFEQYFTAYSSQAMRETLGLETETLGRSTPFSTRRPSTRRPPTATRAGSDSEQIDPDLPYRLARHLWTARTVAMIEGRLGQIESLEEQSQLVALAATIPVGSMRSALLKSLRKHFEDGPSPLESAELTKQLVSDPGLLLVVKTLVRKQLATRTATKEAREKFLKAKEDWAKFVQDSMRVWCARFHATALARAEAARLAGEQPGAQKPRLELPITLHEGAEIAAEYHLTWPGDLLTKLSGTTPGAMQIHYVRIQEKARLKTRVGYYKRQLRLRETQSVEKGEWLDGLRLVPQTDQVRSVDVLITRLEDASDQDSAEAEELTIEILSIEMKGPEES